MSKLFIAFLLFFFLAGCTGNQLPAAPEPSVTSPAPEPPAPAHVPETIAPSSLPVISPAPEPAPQPLPDPSTLPPPDETHTDLPSPNVSAGHSPQNPITESHDDEPRSESVFFESDGIQFAHYWPGSKKENWLGEDESEILIFTSPSSPAIRILSSSMDYIVNDETVPVYSGTWEKFPSRPSWDRIEYIDIGSGNRWGPLVLQAGQKGKLHYHYEFDHDLTNADAQAVDLQIVFEINGQEQTLETHLERKE